MEVAARTLLHALAALCIVTMGGIAAAHAATPRDELSIDLAPEIDRVARIPERFAVEVRYAIGLESRGSWTSSGTIRTWTYEVRVPGAVSLSFHAARASLPRGAVLTVAGGGAVYRYGPQDIRHGHLWSRIARGDTLTFTLSVGASDASTAVLEIVGLQAGFRSLGGAGPNHPRYDAIRQSLMAGSTTVCVENFECHLTSSDQGPGQASVTLVISNLGLCSGVLMNNAVGDGTPYVLTARHCENGNPDGGDPSAASGVTAYFDAVTACGQPLAAIYGAATAAITGATTVVEQQDAWLIRMEGTLPVADAYFSGWDATGGSFVGGYTPNYALGNTRQYTGWYGQAVYQQIPPATLGVHFTSTFWELVNQVGSIAPGASGSGVFDPGNHLVGTIVRGVPQTTDPESPGVCPAAPPPTPSPTTATGFATAFSGIFSSTADPQSTTGAATLQSVLDPKHTGVMVLDGKWMPPQFSTSVATASTGTMVTLSWFSPGATSCSASGGLANDGWSGSLAGSGSLAVTEYTAGAVTYSLSCTSGALQSIASVTVTWSLAAPAATIQVSSGSNGWVGSSIQLTWSATVAPCVATGGIAGDGWSGTFPGHGTLTVVETAAGTYTYGVTCGSGTRTATAQTQVTFAGPSATLQDGGISSANIGLPVTLTGTGAGTSCVASGGAAGDGWAGINFLGLGVYTVTETVPGTYTYTFACTAGSITATASVTVVFSNGPPSVTLTTTPSAPTIATSFLHVSWVASVAPCSLSVSGYTSYTLSNYSYIGYHDDSQNVIGPYTYTVTCGSGSSTATASKTVNWVGTPQLTLSAGSSPVVLGTPISVVWLGNVTPCTASGGAPGDGWTGTMNSANGFLAVTEAQAGTYSYSMTCGSGTQTAHAQATLTINSGTVFATLVASATTSPEGTPVTLTWNSNTSPCVETGDYGGGGWHNSSAASGTTSVVEVIPGTYTYAMTCGFGPSTTASAQVTVTFTGPAPPTLTVSNTNPYAGQAFSISWASADGSACTATLGGPGDGWAGARAASGSVTITETVPGTYTYGLRCGAAAPSYRGATVGPAIIVPPPPPPPSVQLKFDAGTTFANQAASLSWTSSGVTACIASGGSGTDGWKGNVASSGSQSITESSPGSYAFNISCTGSGTATAQATLVVNPAPTATLSASTSSASVGQAFTLTWQSTETTSCSASGGSAADGWSGSEPTSGSASITESQAGTYSYAVDCTGGSEMIQAATNVVVTARATGGGGEGGGGGEFDEFGTTMLAALIGARAFCRRRPVPAAR